MAGSNTIGLGVGVIILIILWTVTAFLWVLLSRSQTGLRTVITYLSVFLTFIMFIIPTSEDQTLGLLKPAKKAIQIYDFMFIWKALLIVLLLVSIIAAGGIHMGQFWTMKVRASSPVPRQKLQVPIVEEDGDE